MDHSGIEKLPLCKNMESVAKSQLGEVNNRVPSTFLESSVQLIRELNSQEFDIHTLETYAQADADDFWTRYSKIWISNNEEMSHRFVQRLKIDWQLEQVW